MTRWPTVGLLAGMMLSVAAVALACPDAKKVRLVERPDKGRVDVNRASRAELMKLEGVDGAMADRIIARRPFREVRDLEKVPRVGRAVIAKNAGRLVVR